MSTVRVEDRGGGDVAVFVDGWRAGTCRLWDGAWSYSLEVMWWPVWNGRYTTVDDAVQALVEAVDQ